ncbi:MAG: hypothetical protein ABI644_07835 [Arenimonas sp.]
MNTFLFGDQTLLSNIDFKELPRQTSAAFSLAIHIQLLPPCLPAAHIWLHEWKETDESTTLSLALMEVGYLLRFPDVCDFVLDTKARQISVIPHEALDEHTIEHLLVDQVLPRFLANEGHLLLHACAVNVNGRTLLFLGKSGWGKSTLAALFHQAGYPLYSDDCVLLKQKDSTWQVIATYPSLRLYEDSIENNLSTQPSLSPVSEYSDKQRIALSVGQEHSVPCAHAMYFLSDPETAPEAIQISPMRPGLTCIEVIQRSFRLDLGNHLQSRHLMTSAAALTQSIPAFRLSYPHDFENNERLLETLLQHIQQ